MRRTEEGMKKVRLRIIDLKKEGLGYEAIRRKTGASPNTIAGVVKNFAGRYCHDCGETDVKVLEEHHPDKANQPGFTVTFCANCHERVTRKQMRDMTEKKPEVVTATLVPTNPPALVQQNTQAVPAGRPMTKEELQQALLFFGGAGCILNACDRQKTSTSRVWSVIGAGICFLQLFSKQENNGSQ